ncbi:MAG: sigma-54-dependent Fis family transcriptional regulator [Lysobacter sp.]|nr:sigma-54-dependent Fis family transcriptional regulator [Lysobacter sp.]
MPDQQRNASARILVVDDQSDVREALQMLLKFADYTMTGASSPEEALALLEREHYAAALVDMNYSRDTTSGAEGLALIARINALRPTLPVIAMTAWANIELAVEAMRVGATDFIEKPWQNARVLGVLEMRIPAERRRSGERHSLAQDLLDGTDAGFIAESAAMRRLMDDLARVTDSDASVLLLGENGTGKSLIAQRLHRGSSRRDKAFVRVDIGGLTPTLFEAELFGHVRGAYTDARQDRAGRFELADGGTLFLDEIGNLPSEQQPKLLRAIEDGEFERLGSSRTRRVDVRIIAATNADLDAEVAAGRFRRDLLYRLNTFQARVPPLVERRDDILPLAHHYLALACRRYRRPLPTLGNEVEQALLGYAWPGNVRELAHAMERAALLGGEGRLSAADLRLHAAAPMPAHERPQLERMRLDEAEAMLLRAALEQHQGNLQRAADQLGITRQSLYRRLEKHGLRGDDAD